MAEEKKFEDIHLVLVNCYNHNVKNPPIPTPKKITNLIKESSQVNFGLSRKWKNWQTDIEESFGKEFNDKDLKVSLFGFSPRPVFIFIGKNIGQTYQIHSIWSFNGFNQNYENWITETPQFSDDINEDVLFNVFTDIKNPFQENESQKTKTNPKIQLFFGATSKSSPIFVDNSIDICMSLIPKELFLFPKDYPQAKHEINNFLRNICYKKYPGSEFVVTTSMPNPLNFCIGTLWKQNVFGDLQVYDIINRKYEKAEMDF